MDTEHVEYSDSDGRTTLLNNDNHLEIDLIKEFVLQCQTSV